MPRIGRAGEVLVAVGSSLAAAGTAHAAVNAVLWRRPFAPRAAAGGSPARVSVLIPARDEVDRIGDCVASVAGADVLEVLVYDDCSADATAELAARHGATVLAGTEPPPGWLGKPHACARLAAASSGDVLVFLDADVRLEPGAIGSALALLDSTRADLISPQPREIALGPAERLVQPLLVWSLLTVLPLRISERSARPSLAAANGQFVVIRRGAYERCGGHVPGAVLDDIALARAVRRAGGRAVLVDGASLAHCRMYSDWLGIRDGYTRSLWTAFGSPAGSAAVVGVLVLAYVLPALAAARGSRVGVLGYLAAVLGRVITARRAGERVWPDAALHPVSISAFVWLCGRSHVRHRQGRLTWRSRPVG